MKVENVFDIYQNCSLGALLLNEFVLSYEKLSKEKRSPPLEKILPVLPILFTKEIVKSSTNRSTNIKGFYNLIEDNKILFALLQSKVEEAFEKTMFSLFVCHQSNLLDVDLKNNVVRSNVTPRQKYTAPSVEVGDLIRTSRKLGGWFSGMSEVEFLIYLNIKF